MYAVTVEPLNTVFFLGERPEGAEWEVREGVGIDVPFNYADWPEGTDRPEAILCVSTTDPTHYKVFRRRRDVDPGQFQPTGRNFGGVLSRTSWERFRREVESTLRAQDVPDDDPPGAMEEALRNIRGGR